MIKKVPFLILSILLILTPLQVEAKTKSITKFGSEDQISIEHESLEISYNNKTGRVYYGENGIDILLDEEHVHIDTDFAVKYMIILNDINTDEYPDFVTWQNTSEYTDQVIIISGKDGSVIDSLRFTHNMYNDSLSDFVDKNSHIQQFYSCEQNMVYIISDYNLYKYDLVNKEFVFITEFENNVWKITEVSDLNNDGKSDLALTGQDGKLYYVNSINGEIMSKITCAKVIEKDVDYGWSVNHFTHQLSLWDILYEKEKLYITSENGIMYIADGMNISEYDISVFNDDELMNVLTNYQTIYDRSSGQNKIIETGLNEWGYMSYRIADSIDGYLLIEAYMRDDFSNVDKNQSYMAANYPSNVIIFDTSSNTVVSKTNIPNNPFSGMQKTCFGKYNNENVFPVITELDEEAFKVVLYSLNGEVVEQKNIENSILKAESDFSIHYRNGHYEFEVDRECSFALSENLSYEGYTYDLSKYEFYGENQDYIYLKKYNNGKFVSLCCFDKKLNPIWQYDYTATYSNKGISYIDTGKYNKDEVNDFLLLAQQYNTKDEIVCTWFIVVDGKTGAVLLNKNLKLGTYYDEKKKKHNYYQISDKASLIKDVDKDGKAEILVDGEFILSKSFKKNGYINTSIDVGGYQLSIGDINNDGFEDKAVVTNKETRLYQSKLTSSYGYYSVEYVKTKVTRKNEEKLENGTYATVFGDINNDGAKEIIHLGYNEKGYEVYIVTNGKTLKDMYVLCKDGVRDYGERFALFEYDINNDGYNEIIGAEDYQITNIYDGKTGEILLSDVGTWTGDKYYKDDYRPNYIVPFYEYNQLIYFYKSSDINNDGIADYLLMQAGYDYDVYENFTLNRIIDGSNCETISEDKQYNNSFESSFIKINGNDSMIIADFNNYIQLVNINGWLIEAKYNIGAKSVYWLDDENIMSVDEEGKISILDIQKEFDVLTEIPEYTEEYKLNLKWNTKLDYSVMSIYDNDNLVYRGQDEEYELKLIEGKHSLSFQLDNNRGKSSARSYNIEVAPQKGNRALIYIMPFVLICLSVILALYRKLRIKAAAKAVKK